MEISSIDMRAVELSNNSFQLSQNTEALSIDPAVSDSVFSDQSSAELMQSIKHLVNSVPSFQTSYQDNSISVNMGLANLNGKTYEVEVANHPFGVAVHIVEQENRRNAVRIRLDQSSRNHRVILELNPKADIEKDENDRFSVSQYVLENTLEYSQYGDSDSETEAFNAWFEILEGMKAAK